ncbi:uncharacterized protein TRIVIDRAFT_34593 [Trichoderma virens Gv29-8]|uniref:Uncharacterized protein n=1 Tax=Hypocrea virens (strain Gv29-8 / FGSC 10586) TaxID=413071 RepID=G9ME20_HYPVG|nr:uncharacterized protein TRIVIDRAFT_34593 [Trichoderma virens Gv29-8]EHK27315.1 hypothetical protein TRIVIDRAFT_34593 [Trichoderma virens Gv29-8]
MSNSLDIHDILQTGYFTTSRARHGHSASVDSSTRPGRSYESTEPPVSRIAPRYYDDIPHRRRSILPPPTVEDEAESLAKEFGGRVKPVLEEEPQSRGEIDQQPLMLEVHEFNPERRFVIVPGSESATDDGASRDKLRQEKEKKKERKKASASPSPEAYTRKTNEPEKKDSDRLGDAIPRLERRGSRQELPRLETDIEENRIPSHHRSKSAASGIRPEFAQSYRKYGEEYLSPQVTKHGSSGRDKTYYGYGQPPTQSSVSLGEPNDKKWDDDKYHRRSATVSAERPNSSFEASRRPTSNDRINGPRPLDGNRPPRDDLREGGHAAYKSSPVDNLRAPQNSRSPSRVPTMPLVSANSAEPPDDWVPNRRVSTTFPIGRDKTSQEHKTPPAIYLPYPDDDDAIVAWPDASAEGDDGRQAQAVSATSVLMPPIPQIDDELVAPDDKSVRSPSPKEPAVVTKPWQPPPFDPNKSGVRPDQTVGSYRRYSETRGHEGQSDLPNIPECKRTVPVAGKMDWLTLPRTDFNICPDCYGAVFAETQFRTHFHPVLRPTGNPIACDFGSSPWYRIAWLLTLKHKVPDLQLFHHLATIMMESRDYPCPLERKVTRVWYTVKDPYTRRPVPEFAVCYQCAKTVETLFPNLTGVFIPLDSRGDPSRNVCSLHFTPQRKQFVLFFDAFETTSDKSYVTNKKPDYGDLSMMLTRLSTLNECREDRRVSDGYWYVMEYLPDFTVCGECYEDVVRPQRTEDNVIAQNFYMKPTKLPVATCQLYSPRMREIFKRACRNKDPEYLEAKVRERLKIEKDVHAKFLGLVRDKRNSAWTDEQIDKLSREWKRWE